MLELWPPPAPPGFSNQSRRCGDSAIARRSACRCRKVAAWDACSKLATLIAHIPVDPQFVNIVLQLVATTHMWRSFLR